MHHAQPDPIESLPSSSPPHSSWRRARRFAAGVAIAGLVAAGAAQVDAWRGGVSGNVDAAFDRTPPEVVSPSGQSVLADCQDGPVDPDGWPEATAELKIRKTAEGNRVRIRVRAARPHTYYTVWLRLGGADSNGNPFGGNPVTGGQATPLSPTWDLPNLLTATGTGNGRADLSNGFWTDRRGNATLRTSLDFPIVAGAYPFQRFPNWDPTDPRLPAAEPAIHPVAIAGPQGIYTLRIVSHCTDQLGHGLQSGPRELWFDWTAPA